MKLTLKFFFDTEWCKDPEPGHFKIRIRNCGQIAGRSFYLFHIFYSLKKSSEKLSFIDKNKQMNSKSDLWQ